MQKTKVALAALLAALLLTPPASAGKSTRENAVRALIAQGLEDLDRQAFTAAIRGFSQAAENGGGSAAFFLLGYAHFQRGFMGGNPDSADKTDAMETVDAYREALALDPELKAVSEPHRFYHSLALSYEALGLDDKAMEAYKTGFELAPENPMFPLYAARLRYKMNDLAKSARNLRLSFSRARKAGQAASLLSLVKTDPLFAEMRKSPAHLQVMRESEEALESAKTVALRSQVLGGETLRDSVRESAPRERRVEIREQDKAVLEALKAADEQFRYRRFRDCLKSYEEVLTLNERSGVLSPSQTAMIYENIGTSYNRLGLSGEAIRALQRSVQSMPFNTAAHYQLALAYSLSGYYTESLRALSETFKTAPTNSELRKFMLLAKTDSELEPIRDLPGFRTVLSSFSERLQGRG